jgi:hypothetical protein
MLNKYQEIINLITQIDVMENTLSTLNEHESEEYWSHAHHLKTTGPHTAWCIALMSLANNLLSRQGANLLKKHIPEYKQEVENKKSQLKLLLRD